jgi:predicted acyl esterase
MSPKVGSVEVLQTSITPLTADYARYEGFKPGTTTLPKGFRRTEENRPFDVDTLWERDTPIPMRDGTVLYGDVFRPANTFEKVPILLAWSPYGKSGTGMSYKYF